MQKGTAREGDTLSKISAENLGIAEKDRKTGNITSEQEGAIQDEVEKLIKINGLKSDKIIAGKKYIVKFYESPVSNENQEETRSIQAIKVAADVATPVGGAELSYLGLKVEKDWRDVVSISDSMGADVGVAALIGEKDVKMSKSITENDFEILPNSVGGGAYFLECDSVNLQLNKKAQEAGKTINGKSDGLINIILGGIGDGVAPLGISESSSSYSIYDSKPDDEDTSGQ
jgi:hypothetical protein